MFRLSRLVSITSAIVLCATPAFAHPGHDLGHSALDGLLHPLSGIDHMLAMVSVGLLAFCLGGRALWTLPLAFAATMAVGGVLGATGFALPGIEQGIAASMLVLGALIAAAIRLPLLYAIVLVGAFAIFHGMAHGLEGVAGGTMASAYFLGFLLATMALHGAGIAFGAALGAVEKTNLVQRVAGAVVGLAGLWMIAG